MRPIIDAVEWQIRPAESGDLEGMVALQRACFPAPFPEDLLWQRAHLERHLELFPEGQLVAVFDKTVIASASNTLLAENHYQRHLDWDQTVGGYFLDTLDPMGTTLYGLDISVAPVARRQGLGRALYAARFELVRRRRLTRYATGCRLPDFHRFDGDLKSYLAEVESGNRNDRTLSPLLRYGLSIVGSQENYMEDEESRNCAARLEWTP